MAPKPWYRVALLWLSLSGGLVSAEPLAPGVRDFRTISAELGLDEGQQARVAEAIRLHKIARVDLKAQAEKAEIELRYLLAAQKLDEIAVRAAVETLSAAEAALRRSRVELAIALRRELSAEQWATLQERWEAAGG